MEKKASILIVDDNDSLCKTMSFTLEHKGYAVTTASDGYEAVERVEEKSFDIIFMDIKMPVMNGVETYKRLKNIRPEAIVMMMTAYSVEDLVQEALREGAYGILYKPLDIEKVVVFIDESKKVKQGALILVVDDDPGTSVTLKNVLVNRGHKVGTAHTGEEAIAKAQESMHDIVFIDMKLPTINGLETYLAIKEIDPKAIAIIISGYREEMGQLVHQAISHSAYACLYKPFDLAKMLDLVDEIMARKRKTGLTGGRKR
jgi:DNA-binding NtrC family response regulator